VQRKAALRASITNTREEEVTTVDGGGLVPVGVAGGDEGGEDEERSRGLHGAGGGGVKEEAEQGIWVRLSEVTAERPGECHRAAPRCNIPDVCLC
jgi:hypothetical protein